ncbi:ABC transporter ATP-binding protein [Herpetosiphon giganteus]|uniref:ABC transporter ATP-binding protein n=1 Tax=Herpetosiphon giganteus TaxID=2029754 RepID=UPI00195BC95B|nr:ABC transporter ATP-binding protein [Herpetosiphon giganteus]MBM7842018.1 ABC-type Fe3+/spermidine/putrescine transport system ATPase subunit [Herpetosiphon giganteus]
MLHMQGIRKQFEQTLVLRDIDLTLNRGEILALLGPSGCGKSTLLRIIAGLESADQGQLLLHGQPLNPIPIHRRNFGLMFQDWALFPHRNVGENIEFGLRMEGMAKAQRQQRLAEMLELVGLVGYQQRSVQELSGGERQRVALARSLAPRPQLLMLDEPLGSLDRTLRERLTEELRQIIKAAEVTAIYVTHDQNEAFVVADRLAVMNAGQIIQLATPQAIYQQPKTAFVARFLSLTNLLPIEQQTSLSPELQAVETNLGPFQIQSSQTNAAYLLIRPEAAQIAQTANQSFQGIVVEQSFRGSYQRIAWRYQHGLLQLDLPSSYQLSQGQTLDLTFDAQQLSLVQSDH